jgi:hypothetical protein
MTSIYCCGQRIIAADAAHDEHYANDLVARSGGLLETATAAVTGHVARNHRDRAIVSQTPSSSDLSPS